MARRLFLIALNPRDGQAHPTHGAVIPGFNLNQVLQGRFRWDGLGQQPNPPYPRPQNGGEHDDGNDDIQAYSLSMMRALAMPPPSHMVWRP